MACHPSSMIWHQRRWSTLRTTVRYSLWQLWSRKWRLVRCMAINRFLLVLLQCSYKWPPVGRFPWRVAQENSWMCRKHWTPSLTWSCSGFSRSLLPSWLHGVWPCSPRSNSCWRLARKSSFQFEGCLIYGFIWHLAWVLWLSEALLHT